MAGNQYLLSDAINDRAARAGDRHWRRSSLCIILRSTLELRTQMPRGSETPTRLPQFLDDTRAYCWSRGRTYSSFGPNCVRGHFSSRRLPSHSNHAGRRFSESSLQPSVCTHGFPDRIRKRGYSPCTGGGVSRGRVPTAAPKKTPAPL
jgi:hypothetical protein